MVAGVDRYYQIARCFRDEDLRGDRQPEFTQLDIEMSFVDEAAVMDFVEAMIIEVSQAVVPDRPILQVPFPRLTYAEAMDKYGSDKPDLRFGMEMVNLAPALTGGGRQALLRLPRLRREHPRRRRRQGDRRPGPRRRLAARDRRADRGRAALRRGRPRPPGGRGHGRRQGPDREVPRRGRCGAARGRMPARSLATSC